MMTEHASELTVDDIDLSDPMFWGRPPEERTRAFALLRAQEDVPYFTDPQLPLVEPGGGYWALVRYADVAEASRAPEVFSSEPNVTSVVDPPEWLAKYSRDSMINMDDPRHARIRQVVSREFTPKMLAKTEGDIARRATRIVDELIESGPGDFVEKVAARLPTEVICDMLGIPDEYYPRIGRLTNVVLGNIDMDETEFDTAEDVGLAVAKIVDSAHSELHELAVEFGRRNQGADSGNLTTMMLNAEIDGEKLTSQEFSAFFELMLIAGNETTRTAIAHGLKLLTDHPDQRGMLLEDFDGRIAGAVEEIVRYASPIISFRRNLTRDYEMNGHHYKAGEKVLLFYNSANRDEAVFEAPDRFDITRSPNPHLGFGGPGPHFCLGANLARREITVMFRELFTRLPDIRSEGAPELAPSSSMNGYKSLPCTFTQP